MSHSEESKQEVEGDEEAKEASDVGHPPVMHGTRDKILAKDDIRSSRYILLSVQTPVGVYRFTQQGFCGRSNLPLVFCHSLPYLLICATVTVRSCRSSEDRVVKLRIRLFGLLQSLLE